MNKRKNKNNQSDKISKNNKEEEMKDTTENNGENLKEDGTNNSEKDEKLSQLEVEIAELKDKLLRRAAEFENYKRRTENDQLNLFKYAAESFIVKLLPVVDDFERSLLHIENSKDIKAIQDGIKLVYDKLIKVLNEQGVEKINSLGEPFNVDLHDALMQRPVENVEPHTVVDEIEKGYMYKDRVIRHAKVIVSEAPPEETNNSSTDKESEENQN